MREKRRNGGVSEKWDRHRRSLRDWDGICIFDWPEIGFPFSKNDYFANPRLAVSRTNHDRELPLIGSPSKRTTGPC